MTDVKPRSALNSDQAFLHWLAALFMVTDHVGAALLPQVPVLRLIGRLAFPLYCMGIVQGCLYTRSHWRYALRLFCFALLSQYPYMKALGHDLLELNVIFTLLLGMLAVWGMQAHWRGSALWLPALSLFLSATVPMDYGWQGVLLIMLMYLCRDSRRAFAAMFVAFCLLWGARSFDLFSWLRVPAPWSLWPQRLSGLTAMLRAVFTLQGMAVLALPLMVIPTRTGLQKRRLVYLVYPGHLLLIWLVLSIQ